MNAHPNRDGGLWSPSGIGPQQAERNRRANAKEIRRRRYFRMMNRRTKISFTPPDPSV